MGDANAKKFHKHLKEFLKALIGVFPEDRDIKVISSSLNIAMMDDPDNLIITNFHDAMSPHEKLIHTRDPQFFYQDPSSIKNTLKQNQSNTQYMLFDKLHSYWETLTEENRVVVWDYFQLLFRISTEVYEVYSSRKTK
jgi:hypothetical protein